MMTMTKVLVIGLDGADFKIINPLVESGELPTFKKIIIEGAFGNLKSTLPPRTVPAWPCFFTGKNPGKVGVFDFAYNEPGTNRMVIIDFNEITTPTVWDVLNEYGKRTYAFNIPLTYPVKKINGIMMSGMTTPSEDCEYTYPTEFKQKINEICGEKFKIEPTPITKTTNEKYLEEVLKITKNNEKILDYIIEQKDWDLGIFIFRITDVIQHQFWMHTNMKEVINAYKEMDLMLANVIGKIDNETNIIIMSDHGATLWQKDKPVKVFHVIEWLSREDFLSKKSEKVSKVSVYNFLKRFGIDLRRLMPVSMKKKIFDPLASIEWDKTKAYLMNYEFRYGGIRINLKEREKTGIVKKEEYENLINEIKNKLIKLKDPETNEKMIDDVWFSSEVYKGEKVKNAPDIIFKTADNYTPRNLMHSEITSIKQEIGGIHDEYGILMAIGPDIKKSEVKGAEIIDIAPTILSILKIPIPSDIDGKVIKSMLKSDESRKMNDTDEKTMNEKKRIMEKLRNIKLK